MTFVIVDILVVRAKKTDLESRSALKIVSSPIEILVIISIVLFLLLTIWRNWSIQIFFLSIIIPCIILEFFNCVAKPRYGFDANLRANLRWWSSFKKALKKKKRTSPII